ncbi:MAG TPA: nitroreductase [Burkholderiales bacterium]
MELDRIVSGRYSCRKYLPKPVPRETIDAILELAQKTPSWCNTQPWNVILLSGAAADRFREAMHAHASKGEAINPDFPFPPRYEGVYRDRRKVCGVQLYQALKIGREDKAAAAEQSLENFRMFGAPHLALITSEAELGVYGAVDCGLYVSNFMLAAGNHGVATIAQAALASYPEFIRRYFDLPANRKMICGIALGYADESHPINGYRTARVPLADSVRYVD